MFYGLVVMGLFMGGCNKCYECSKSTSSSSSTQGACFETAKDARNWKKDMEENGFDCRVVPEP